MLLDCPLHLADSQLSYFMQFRKLVDLALQVTIYWHRNDGICSIWHIAAVQRERAIGRNVAEIEVVEAATCYLAEIDRRLIVESGSPGGWKQRLC